MMLRRSVEICKRKRRTRSVSERFERRVEVQGREADTHELFSTPQRLRLPDRRRESSNPLSRAVSLLGSKSSVDELMVLLPREEGSLLAHPHSGVDVILDETSKRLSRRRYEVVGVGVGDVVGLGSGGLGFWEREAKSEASREERRENRRLTSEMDVHLVTIEVGVVGVTDERKIIASVSETELEKKGRTRLSNSPVGVVHPDRLLSVQNLGSVTHHTRLVKRRLSVEKKDISVSKMSEDLLVDRWRLRRESSVRRRRRSFLRDEELVGDGSSLLGGEFVL